MLIKEHTDLLTGLRQRWFTTQYEADQALAAMPQERRGRLTWHGPVPETFYGDKHPGFGVLIGSVCYRVDDVLGAAILKPCEIHGGFWTEGCGVCKAALFDNLSAA